MREGVEDQLIYQKAKGEEGLTREQIESRIVVPHHTIFLQFFSLYILPVICIAAGYVFFILLGLFDQKAARSGHSAQPISCCNSISVNSAAITKC